MNISEFNALSTHAMKTLIMDLCFCESWADAVVEAAPYKDRDALAKTMHERWQNISENDLMQAISAHPRIGDIQVLKDKFATQAHTEQGQVMAADEAVLGDLILYNDKYYDKFGFIFIICAKGKSAQFMLEALKKRLNNCRDTELENAAKEQQKISALRLQQTISTQH